MNGAGQTATETPTFSTTVVHSDPHSVLGAGGVGGGVWAGGDAAHAHNAKMRKATEETQLAGARGFALMVRPCCSSAHQDVAADLTADRGLPAGRADW
jgi:hypothetical protein